MQGEPGTTDQSCLPHPTCYSMVRGGHSGIEVYRVRDRSLSWSSGPSRKGSKDKAVLEQGNPRQSQRTGCILSRVKGRNTASQFMLPAKECWENTQRTVLKYLFSLSTYGVTPSRRDLSTSDTSHCSPLCHLEKGFLGYLAGYRLILACLHLLFMMFSLYGAPSWSLSSWCSLFSLLLLSGALSSWPSLFLLLHFPSAPYP